MITEKIRRGTIVQIDKPGHGWHGKRVVVYQVRGIHDVETELLEQQSLPVKKRLICGFSRSEVVTLSHDSQQQTASTLGLHLADLPYVEGSHAESELPMHLRAAV